MTTRGINFRTTLLLLIASAAIAFASEDGKRTHEQHSSDDGTHICFGVGLHGELYRGGIQARLWLNDVIGFNLKGHKNWANNGGGGFNAEVMFKPALNFKFRPYVLAGYGYNTHNVDTVFQSDPFTKDLGMSWLRLAVGGEMRLGKNDHHGLSAELGYVNGSADYIHSYTIVGNPDTQFDTVTYEMDNLTLGLLYTFYFCKAKKLDRDGDGIHDDVDNCSNDAEDMDGFKDTDGCPDYDNDGDGIADSLDEYPDSVVVPDESIVLEGVLFLASSSEIDEASLTLLDSVAALLIEEPESKLVLKERLRGDSSVADEEKLTNARVAAIMDYLEFKEVSSGQVDEMTIEMENSNKEQRDRIRKEGLVIRNLKFDGDGLDSLSSQQIDSILILSKEWTEADITLESTSHNDEMKLSTARVSAVMAYLLASGADTSQVERIVEQIALGKKMDVAKEGLVLRQTTFDSWSSTIKESSFEELDALIKMLQVWPEIKIEVQGHTDNIGLESDNQKLSQERAASVADYFIKGGVSSDKIIVKGYGELSPKEPNETVEGRKANRRVELKQINDANVEPSSIEMGENDE